MKTDSFIFSSKRLRLPTKRPPNQFLAGFSYRIWRLLDQTTTSLSKIWLYWFLVFHKFSSHTLLFYVVFKFLTFNYAININYKYKLVILQTVLQHSFFKKLYISIHFACVVQLWLDLNSTMHYSNSNIHVSSNLKSCLGLQNCP